MHPALSSPSLFAAKWRPLATGRGRCRLRISLHTRERAPRLPWSRAPSPRPRSRASRDPAHVARFRFSPIAASGFFRDRSGRFVQRDVCLRERRWGRLVRPARRQTPTSLRRISQRAAQHVSAAFLRWSLHRARRGNLLPWQDHTRATAAPHDVWGERVEQRTRELGDRLTRARFSGGRRTSDPATIRS